jgi:TonB family protein
MLKQKILLCVISLCFISILSVIADAQEISFNYYYSFERADVNEPPKINGFDIDYPETARKNGVQGMLKASMTLGENGKVRDIKILQTLPFGVEAAVTKGLQTLYFKPAGKNGQPMAITMNFDFVVTAVYSESDKNVTKPKILDKPAPIYPSKYAAEKLKGKVQVSVLFYTDGKVKVLSTSSVMPREFDKAAIEAAEKLRFQPAVHKKSKEDVAQKMLVEYEFKP